MAKVKHPEFELTITGLGAVDGTYRGIVEHFEFDFRKPITFDFEEIEFCAVKHIVFDGVQTGTPDKAES